MNGCFNAPVKVGQVKFFVGGMQTVIGQAKTHLQHILIAVAINLARFVAWINEVPLAKTRTSAFAALAGAEI